MAILGLQQQQTEVGRIRFGILVPKKGGGERPEKLDRLRFTSPRKALIEKIQALYGGKVEPWQPPRGAQQWQVITNVTEVPVMVPPQDPSESQWYEMWTAGGCKRRCDGQQEKISKQACLCDPANRACKMHTRLRVMLEDVPGLGAWRVDTGSYYAAVELPGIATLLAQTSGVIPGRLVLDQRTVTRDGETMHFVVPTLHVEEFTPGQLASGKVQELVAARRAAAIDGQMRTAIAAATATVDYPSMIEAARTVDALVDLHTQALADPAVPKTDGKLNADLLDRFNAKANAIHSAQAPAPEPVVHPDAADAGDDVDTLWAQIVEESPWDDADELESHFCQIVGRSSADAGAEDMRKFLAAMATAKAAEAAGTVNGR